MGQPAAKQNDMVTATDTHIVLVPQPTGPPVPTPLPHPFVGMLNNNLSPTVKIMGLPAATVGSIAQNQPPHFPTPPGTAFQIPPTNMGTVMMGSNTVFFNNKPAARNGDTVQTCNDPSPLPVGKIIAMGTVMIGG
jgi:uncharacterized Zn-binding protein involved in type VI secretion